MGNQLGRTGVVDEDVDPAVLLEHGGNESLTVGRDRDVALDVDRL